MLVLSYIVFFFFSSRRRHTRCSRDWSSDVCSSDLHPQAHSRCCRRRRGDGERAPRRSRRTYTGVIGAATGKRPEHVWAARRQDPEAASDRRRFYHCWGAGFAGTSIGVGANLTPYVTRSLPEAITGSMPDSPLVISISPLLRIPNSTGTFWALPACTVYTYWSASRRVTASIGICSAFTWTLTRSSTRANMPPLRARSGFGMSTSTVMVRVLGFRAWTTPVTLPVNARPGYASARSSAGWAILTSDTS